MKYAVEMGSGAMTYSYIPSIVKICLAIQTLIGGRIQKHTGIQKAQWSHKPYFFKIKKVLYCIETSCCTVYSNFRILTSPSLYNSVRILNSHFEALCPSLLFIIYCLFNTTCLGLNGHHQVYRIVDENCCWWRSFTRKYVKLKLN
jgi:hypothetical protein